MTRTLVLMRHAKAGSKAGSDRKRVLAEKGRRQATAAGPLLSAEVGPVDLALVSGATRTRQTAELLCESLEVARVDVRDELYDADLQEVLALLRDVRPKARTVLLVGHEPTISTTARHLHDAPEDDIGTDLRMGVTTATACVLDVPVAWSELDQGVAHVRTLLRP